jgi:lipooligosaccharide transport system permease protein
MALHRARGRPRWIRSLGYYASAYRRTWRSSVTTSFLYPVLYLAALGVGLGHLVDHHVGHVSGVPYLDFVAPGLLAATAMQVAGNEATYPVLAAVKWVGTYFAMLATPLRVVDVLAGHLAWIALRLSLTAASYLAVMAAVGAVRSPWAVLALPTAVLTGMAFATPISAFAVAQDNDVGLVTIYRFGLIPLFLFSGTFFPVDQLPGWVQPIADATPLLHGVSLCRALVQGPLRWWPATGDALYLVALATVGAAVALRSYRHRLVV